MIKLKIQKQTKKEEKNSLKEVMKEFSNDFRNALTEQLSMYRKILIFSMKSTHFFYRVISGLLLRLAIILFICNIGYPDETKMFVRQSFTEISRLYYSIIQNPNELIIKLYGLPNNAKFFIFTIFVLSFFLVFTIYCFCKNEQEYRKFLKDQL